MGSQHSTPHPEHTVSWEFVGRGEMEKYGSKENDTSKDNTCCGKKIKQTKEDGEKKDAE